MIRVTPGSHLLEHSSLTLRGWVGMRWLLGNGHQGLTLRRETGGFALRKGMEWAGEAQRLPTWTSWGPGGWRSSLGLGGPERGGRGGSGLAPTAQRGAASLLLRYRSGFDLSLTSPMGPLRAPQLDVPLRTSASQTRWPPDVMRGSLLGQHETGPSGMGTQAAGLTMPQSYEHPALPMTQCWERNGSP